MTFILFDISTFLSSNHAFGKAKAPRMGETRCHMVTVVSLHGGGGEDQKNQTYKVDVDR